MGFNRIKPQKQYSHFSELLLKCAAYQLQQKFHNYHMYLPVLMTEMKMHQTRIWSQLGSLTKKTYSQTPKIVKGIRNKIKHFPFFLCFQIVLFSLLSNNTEFQYTVLISECIPPIFHCCILFMTPEYLREILPT